MNPLPAKVERFLARLSVAGHGVVVAVSGGPDSVALLRALLAVRGDAPLVIAHLNHRLRGGDSDADEAFVRELHVTLVRSGAAHLRLRCERVAVGAIAAAERGNLESVARRYRYEWLTRVAREESLSWVATGHTANDQAETVLHRLLRGAGLRGLRGIAARRELAFGIALIRPLLDATRAEVLAYLAAEQQPFREDHSNRDAAFTRNRIRHELLPLLEQRFNPTVVAVLCRLARQADSAYGEVETDARQLLAEAERPRAGPTLVLDRQRLAQAPRPLVCEALRLVWDREGWPRDGMSFDAWERLAAVALGEIPAVDLPGGLRACGRGRVVQLGPRP